LDLRALVCVRLTSSDGDRYVSATLCRRIRILIAPYFMRYWDFVREMRFTGAVIGEQMALNVLYPDVYTPSSMTIFLPNRLFFHMLGYLCQVEGYTAALSNRAGDAGSLQLRTRTATLSRGTKRIELLQSTSDSALHAVLGGWNTALSAYITPSGFCDPYAMLTAAKRALLDPRLLSTGAPLKQEIRDLREEWRSRDWSIGVHPSQWDVVRGACVPEPRSDCAASTRHFGDKHCVAGHLFPVRCRPPLVGHIALDLVEEYTVCWWRGGRVCGIGC
ncbi:hypothetical protein K466DRAFT_466814, partial [Polyporus arcularius HHB13444]